MSVSFLASLILLAIIAYQLGRRQALKLALGQPRQLHSRAQYYGYYVAIWSLLPALLLGAIWIIADDAIILYGIASQLPASIRHLPADQFNLYLNDVVNLARQYMDPQQADPVLKSAAAQYARWHDWAQIGFYLFFYGLITIRIILLIRRIHPQQKSRLQVERVVYWSLAISATIAILTTIGIVLSVLWESLRFFDAVSWTDFLFGLEWSPQIAIRSDQVGSSGAFGIIPLLSGTLLIAGIAVLFATPIGLMSAIYLAEFAGQKFRAWAKPLLEILAGIPTVVYGFFAALIVAPWLSDAGSFLGIDISSESALSAGLVMGVMLIPFISSLSDDVINAIPQAMRDGSYALGATQSETIAKIIVPAALPGIVAGFLLAISRAIGETMIVVMAAGMNAHLTLNPLQSVTTVTVQIVTLLVGDQEFDSPKTLAAFALGLSLFVATLLLNILAVYIIKRYREIYE